MVFKNSAAKLKVEQLNHPLAWEDFYNRFNVQLKNAAAHSLLVDTTAIHFFRPEMVLTLVNAARLWRASRGIPIDVNFNHEAQAYLKRMDLFSACADYLQPMRDVEDRYDRSSASRKLMEVTEISSIRTENWPSVVIAMDRGQSILENAGVDAEIVDEVVEILSEVGQNITHSTDTGFAIIQSYENPAEIGGRRVYIAVSDLGIGIEASLCKRFNPVDVGCNSGSDFIIHALKKGVSSRTETRGIGLSDVSRKVGRARGILFIRSCSSRVMYVNGELKEKDDDLVHIPGVQVYITVFGDANWQ